MRCRSEERVFLDGRLSSDEKVYLLVCCSGRWSRTGGSSALQLAPPQNGRALGDSRACLACKCTRVPLFYLEKKKERGKNQQFSHLAIRCFYGYVLQAAGPCERVRGGGPWEKRAAFG